jgi:unsaturated rhamnogalacturonyl hydrolase
MTVLVLAGGLSAAEAAQKVVALDGFHNNEAQPHYRWEGKYMGGYSELGALLDKLGASRKTITEPLTAKSLTGVDCLIVTDPDIPAEAANPQYFSDAEADAIDRWVKKGGVLVLFGNDPGNAEFEHLNVVAGKFGLKFIEKVHKDAKGSMKLTIAGPADDPVFQGLKFYGVQVAPIEVKNPKAKTLLSDNGAALMVHVPHGKGRVLALGDPWIYDEYIRSQDNYKIAENLFRWLLR